MSATSGKSHLKKMGMNAHSKVESALSLLSVYVVPAAVLVVSIIAIAFWRNTYWSTPPVQVPMQAIFDSTASFSRAQALAALAGAQLHDRVQTSRSNDPLWFVVSPSAVSAEPRIIEFPSRHTTQMTCWNTVTGAWIGSADRLSKFQQVDGELMSAKAGYALEWSRANGPILCRAKFEGPATLTAFVWESRAFDVSVRQYHRQTGLFESGMLVLALFVLIMSIINRQKMYLLFAVWLVLALRTAEISAGCDVRWLGHTIPGNILMESRTTTLTLFGIVSCWLFKLLFRRELANTIPARILGTVMWLSLPMLALGLLLPYGQYLPILWVLTILYGTVMIAGLWKVRLWHANSGRIVIAAFAVVVISHLSEVIAGAFGTPALLQVLNSVTGAMAACLLASFAIAEQIRIETTARIAAQKRLAEAFEAIPAGMFTLDQHGVFIASNPALERMLQLSLGQGTKWSDHFGQEGWLLLKSAVAAHQTDLHLKHLDGESVFSIRATTANDCIEGSIEDATEKLAAVEQLKFLASHDPLTQSLNRRGIELAFNAASERQLEGSPLSLIYLNLNHFKAVNDVSGHEAGDDVLQQVSQRASKMLADGHVIGRVGGDEFVIVMPDTPVNTAELVARSISHRIRSEPYFVGSGYVTVSASIGVVEVAPGTSFDEASAMANDACQQSRNAGRDDVLLYGREAVENRKVQLEMELAERVSATNLSSTLALHLKQVHSRSPSGAVLLLAELGLAQAASSAVSAADIVGAARKTGNSAAVDCWQIETVLRGIENGRIATGSETILLALSGASISDMKFIAKVLPIISLWPNSARKLCLEISEAAAFGDLEQMQAFSGLVRAAGASVSLAKLGSGHTVLANLSKLPVGLVRLDDNIVARSLGHSAGAASVEALVTLSKSLGLQTAACVPAGHAKGEELMARLGVDHVVLPEVFAIVGDVRVTVDQGSA